MAPSPNAHTFSSKTASNKKKFYTSGLSRLMIAICLSPCQLVIFTTVSVIKLTLIGTLLYSYPINKGPARICEKRVSAHWMRMRLLLMKMLSCCVLLPLFLLFGGAFKELLFFRVRGDKLTNLKTSLATVPPLATEDKLTI